MKISLLFTLGFAYKASFSQDISNQVKNGNFDNIQIVRQKFYVSNQLKDNEGELNDTSYFWYKDNRRNIPISSINWNYNNENNAQFNALYSEEKYADSHSGNCFGELQLFVEQSGFYQTSILVGELEKPLIKDSIYTISFFAKPRYANRISNKIDVAFIDFEMNINFELPTGKIDNRIAKSSIAKQFFTKHVPQDFTAYLKYEYTFTAKGGETNIAIGNFENVIKNAKRVKALGSKLVCRDCEYAIYAIDDVVVTANFIKAEQHTRPTLESPSIEVNVEKVLEEILFDFNSSILNTNQISALDTIAKELAETSSLNIELIGYTDSIGTIEYNKVLSIKRAIAVANYLIEKGVNKSRITTTGAGISNEKSQATKKRKVAYKYFY